jgi:hypothetical protein
MIPGDRLQHWVRCGPYIEAALAESRQTHGPADVLLAVGSGRAHFWPGARCAVVTEFWEAPRLKALNFWLLGGDLKELLVMRPQIEAWAIGQGCKQAIGGGVHDRRGWGRVLESGGYRPRWTIYEKDLAA